MRAEGPTCESPGRRPGNSATFYDMSPKWGALGVVEKWRAPLGLVNCEWIAPQGCALGLAQVAPLGPHLGGNRQLAQLNRKLDLQRRYSHRYRGKNNWRG